MNIYIPNIRLPSEYQEVEYIQSSGTQYFVVGNTFKTSYKTVLDFQMVTIGGDYIPLGVNTSTPYKKYGINAYGGYFKVVAGGRDWSNSKSEDTNRHTLTIDKNTVTVDGTDYSINYVDYTYSYGVGVFAYNEDNAMGYHSSNKLYSLQIYDENGDKIYDLVPCYRKSDNVIGMYDIVNSVFYTNQGTGTFTKGADVYTNVLKNIYIGEYKYNIVECDFTQSDNGFTFVGYAGAGGSTSYLSYGRDSNGFYMTANQYGIGATAWKIPSSVYSQGELKKVVLDLYGNKQQNGGGICVGVDTKVVRVRGTGIDTSGWGTTSVSGITTPANTQYQLIIDLENGIASTSINGVTLDISGLVSGIKSDWSAGNMNICAMVYPTYTTGWIQKATFYLSN